MFRLDHGAKSFEPGVQAQENPYLSCVPLKNLEERDDMSFRQENLTLNTLSTSLPKALVTGECWRRGAVLSWQMRMIMLRCTCQHPLVSSDLSLALLHLIKLHKDRMGIFHLLTMINLFFTC